MNRLLRYLCLVLGLGGVAAAPARAENNLTLDFLDVGQGEAILIRTPEGKAALIDAGPRAEDVVAMLTSRKVTSLDLVVLTHHHADRIGNMADVITRFKPKAYLDSGSSHTSAAYRRVLGAVQAQGVPVLRPFPDKERRIELGSVVLHVFPQPPEDKKHENNNSIGIRLVYKDFSALFTGDSQGKERKWWRKNADAELYRLVNVLKIAHYGSRKGVDKTWLKAADPKLAILCCGKPNKHDYPEWKTVDLLHRSQVPLMRTDLNGTITITTDGKEWTVSKERDDEEPTPARPRPGRPLPGGIGGGIRRYGGRGPGSRGPGRPRFGTGPLPRGPGPPRGRR